MTERYKIGGVGVVNSVPKIAWENIANPPVIGGPQTLSANVANCSTFGTVSASVNSATGNVTISIGASGGAAFNCNCQCDCVCDCACDCAGCFLEDEYVLMADGQLRRLGDLRPGDWVACHFQGRAEVLGLRRGLVRGNNMYRINKDLVTTGEHPFWNPATREWMICDVPNADGRVGSKQRLIGAGSTFTPERWLIPPMKTRQMRIGDSVLIGDRVVPVLSIESIHVEPELQVVSPITGGSVIVAGGWVVSAWAGETFDRPIVPDYCRALYRGEVIHGQV